MLKNYPSRGHLLNSSLFFVLIILSFAINSYGQENDDCLMCHSDTELTMEKNGKEISLHLDEKVFDSSVHSNLNCTACHAKFDPESFPHAENLTPRSCLSCHTGAGTKHSFHPRMLTSNAESKTKDVYCAGCHGIHDVISPKSTLSKWTNQKLANSCGDCHKEEKEKFLTSGHFKAFNEEVLGAPTCLNCHRSPIAKIHEPSDSINVKISQEKLCLSCHLDDPNIRSRTGPSAGFITMYEESVHGYALTHGNAKAANCVDCHNSHDIMSSRFPGSATFKSNIPNICAKCHNEIADEYKQSSHGTAIVRGNMDSPVCTDCHGQHNILKHDDPKSPVSFRNVSREVCSPCHSSVRLAEKYGIESNRFKTFSDSYHGLAIAGGSLEVANCASCHGVHNIKPSTDPSSKIHKDNLAETCGTCHPGANVNFTIGRIHITRADKTEPIIYFIATLYISMIITVVGGMFLHNAIDFFRKSKIKKMKQRGLIREEIHGHALYLRMSLNERIQHIVMAGSFILLVITGFMLSYPNSWWVTHIRDISIDAFIYRSLIHRIAAVLMVSVSLYHIFYISFIPRGRQLVKDLFPRLQDFKDAFDVAKFNLGLSKDKPRLDRFSYVEKAEYWALVWGTIIMSITGFIMWFDNVFIGVLTKLGWDIARTIHYYEAWLAFLAIVVWHFYFVIFNPNVYPMSIAWLKGTITEEEMADEHAIELERIKREQDMSENSGPNNSEQKS